MWRTDLRLGGIVYVLVFNNISFSWFFSLNGLEFIFLWRDSENDLYLVDPNQICRIQLIQTLNLPCVESNDFIRRMEDSMFELRPIK